VGEVESPLRELLTPVLLLDVALEAGGVVQLPLVIEGVVGVGDRRAPAHSAVAFADDGDGVVLSADAPARVVVGGGRPLREEMVAGGPFVMNTREELEQASARYRAGAMGVLR
jgi:redox-sensitive bicupin YhaK (pirin superfamily)